MTPFLASLIADAAKVGHRLVYVRTSQGVHELWCTAHNRTHHVEAGR